LKNEKPKTNSYQAQYYATPDNSTLRIRIAKPRVVPSRPRALTKVNVKAKVNIWWDHSKGPKKGVNRLTASGVAKRRRRQERASPSQGVAKRGRRQAMHR